MTRIIIDSLKDKVNDYIDEILRLEAKIALVKACMGAAEAQLWLLRPSFGIPKEDHTNLVSRIVES